MKFKPTEYKLMNVATGRIFDDEGWSLSDPQSSEPSLVRAVYANKKFIPRDDLSGIYRYANWMPVQRTLACRPCASVISKLSACWTPTGCAR